ncbi:HTH domain-containing protein [Alkalinema pantanalense CENA528]|uniref:HTH domain-containing protein n=1 Tax=Alkalinema pantanalense TaxID=1620705 RepID=UPI003D6E0BB9
MSRHLERLLNIDGLLRSGQRQTADAMASVLEVSERTVRKDIELLRDRYGAPIACNRTQGFITRIWSGGYRRSV